MTEDKKEADERRAATSTSGGGSEKAAKFALKHLGTRCGTRKAQEEESWRQNDVRSAMKGFDSQKVGYITTEDFQMALTLLNSQIDRAILRDIPVVPEGRAWLPTRRYWTIFSWSSTAAIADDDDGKAVVVVVLMEGQGRGPRSL